MFDLQGELDLYTHHSIIFWLILATVLISGCPARSVNSDQTINMTPGTGEGAGSINPATTGIADNDQGTAKEFPVILFTEGSTSLSNLARKQIREIARLINQPDIINQSVTINGHSDSLGDAHRNMVISRKRAESVARELVLNGVRNNRLIIRALGESQPLASDLTEEGQVDLQASSRNRRVEVYLGELETARVHY